MGLSKILPGANHAVCTVGTAFDAMSALRDLRYDVAILDCMLPGLRSAES